MAKTNFLNAIQIDGYIDVFYVDPNEPIAKGLIRKNAGEKTFQKIFKLLKRSK